MTRDEWIVCAQRMIANWPHATIPDASIALWWHDVEPLEADEVSAALASFAGDQYPPNGAQIATRVAEIAGRGGLTWSEGLSIADRCPHDWHHPRHGAREALAWIAALDPVAAETVRQFGVEAFAMRRVDNAIADRAQFRQIYESVSTRAARTGRLSLAGRSGGEPRRINAAKVAGEIER